MEQSTETSRLQQLATEHLRFLVNQTDSADTIEIYKELFINEDILKIACHSYSICNRLEMLLNWQRLSVKYILTRSFISLFSMI